MMLRLPSLALAALAILPNSLPVFGTTREGMIQKRGTSKCWQMEDPVYHDENEHTSHIRPRDCDQGNPDQIFVYDDSTKFLKNKRSGDCVDSYHTTPNLKMWPCNDAPQHHFNFPSDGHLKTDDGYCVQFVGDQANSVACSGATDLFDLVAPTAAPTPAPTIAVGSVTGLIKSTVTNKCWESVDPVAGDEVFDNSFVCPRECDMDNDKQIFAYDPVNQFLINADTADCVDMFGGSGATQTHIKMWKCTSVPQQRLKWIGNNRLTTEQGGYCAKTSGDLIVPAACSGFTEGFELIPLTRSPTPNPTRSPTDAPTTSAPTTAPTASGPVGSAGSNSAGGVGGGAAGASPTGSSKSVAGGKVSGDPHLVTFGGTKFDFHGGCDLILVRNPHFGNDLGLEVHIRTQIRTWWSSVKQAVLRIGEETLEVMGGDDGGKFWINGVEGKMEDFQSLSGFEAFGKRIDEHHLRYRIELGFGNGVSIDTFKHFVSVDMKVKNPTGYQGHTDGLMGTFPSGAMVGRDGSTVIEDPVAFGMEWQVLSEEPMLFHDKGEGVHHPEACAMPTLDSEARADHRRRLGESMISEEEAQVACSRVDEFDRDACVFDVLATNDKGMVGAY